MSRFLKLGGMLTILVLLAGAGCSTSPEQTPPSKSANTHDSMDTSTDTSDSAMTLTGDIMLQATAVGARQVKFEWDLDDSIAQPPLFILVRSEEKNPVMDGNTYWLRQHGSRRSVTWVNLPAGEQHFRICTSQDGSTCDIYSDDISLTVLSGPAPRSAEEDDAMMKDAEPGEYDPQDHVDQEEADRMKKESEEESMETSSDDTSMTSSTETEDTSMTTDDSMETTTTVDISTTTTEE